VYVCSTFKFHSLLASVIRPPFPPLHLPCPIVPFLTLLFPFFFPPSLPVLPLTPLHPSLPFILPFPPPSECKIPRCRPLCQHIHHSQSAATSGFLPFFALHPPRNVFNRPPPTVLRSISFAPTLSYPSRFLFTDLFSPQYGKKRPRTSINPSVFLPPSPSISN